MSVALDKATAVTGEPTGLSTGRARTPAIPAFVIANSLD